MNVLYVKEKDNLSITDMIYGVKTVMEQENYIIQNNMYQKLARYKLEELKFQDLKRKTVLNTWLFQEKLI